MATDNRRLWSGAVVVVLEYCQDGELAGSNPCSGRPSAAGYTSIIAYTFHNTHHRALEGWEWTRGVG